LEDLSSIEEHLKKIGITKQQITLWGDGEPKREFLFVDDLADACLYFMNNYDAEDLGEFINVGTGNGIKIRELAEIVKDAVGYKGKIRWDKSKASGMPKKSLNVSKMGKFGWSPKTSLKKGINKAFRWYLNK
jgi:GDP-L-fucose synthase